MAKVLSVINLKGGVGKTTLTVAVAEALAAGGARALVVDLDPQTNSTLMLVGEEKWRELDGEKRTLFHLFQRALAGESVRLEEVILRSADVVRGADGGEHAIDLVPSSVELVQVQDKLINIPPGEFHTRAPATVLRDAARFALGAYDFVIADCPPNLGIVTLNGLLVSDGFVIPTVPDFLSTYGIPQIVDRVRQFGEETGKPVPLLGIVVSKFRKQADIHEENLTRLKAEGNFPVFDAVIGEHVAYARAANHFPGPHTVKDRWENLGAQWVQLAGEIRRKLEELQ